MSHTITTNALINLLDDLEAFEINLNAYFDDLEPQGVIDTVLTGKINSLVSFCQSFGWNDLLPSIIDMTPLRGTAVESLEVIQSFVVPAARRLLSSSGTGENDDPIECFWKIIHPQIAELARPRFENGFFADAVEASLKEVNDRVKQIVRDTTGEEFDGAKLMTTAFSAQRPLIRLTELQTETDQNIQKGYMQIMAGAMTGIRNPKAHGNLTLSEERALHLICLASLLMHKIQERILAHG